MIRANHRMSFLCRRACNSLPAGASPSKTTTAWARQGSCARMTGSRLIEGELVEMAAIGTKHFSCVNRLNRLLVMNVDDEAIVSVQNPVRLNEHTEPQPDLTVIRPRDYRESLPMPEDVLLLIEVSDTTLAYEGGVKLPLYARVGIREVRIVDLPGETVARFTDPSADCYRRADQMRRGQTLESTALPGLTPSVDEVLG
jgi:Uma2 family endonuclease